MKTRCTNPRRNVAHIYVARGITVCERWRSFENFLADMGERPPGTSIDRIDNDRGYEPGNCRWATPREQSRNSRRIRWIAAFGESQPITEWQRRFGIDRHIIARRLRNSWTPERAVSDTRDGRAVGVGLRHRTSA